MGTLAETWSVYSKFQTHCLDNRWLMFKSEELGKVKYLLDWHRFYFCVIRKKHMKLFLLQGSVYFSPTKWFPFQDHWSIFFLLVLLTSIWTFLVFTILWLNNNLRRSWKGPGFCKENGLKWRENYHIFLGFSLFCRCRGNLFWPGAQGHPWLQDQC